MDATDFRLVIVEWHDSFGCSSDWRTVDNPSPDVVVCRSVGWLVYDGKDCKTIVPHLSTAGHSNVEQQGCGDMTIPSRAIVSVVDLIPKSKRGTKGRLHQ